jgi:hypothetical protein
MYDMRMFWIGVYPRKKAYSCFAHYDEARSSRFQWRCSSLHSWTVERLQVSRTHPMVKRIAEIVIAF